MEQIVIQVNDKQKAQALKNFLQALDFVETIASTNIPVRKVRKVAIDVDFFSLAGLWAGREITLDTIRQQAWPERSGSSVTQIS